MPRVPWTKAFDILAQTLQMSAAAARGIVDTARSYIHPHLDTFSIIPTRPKSTINVAEDSRVSVIARDAKTMAASLVRTEEIEQTDRHRFIHCKYRCEREPLRYYTWLNHFGAVHISCLQRIMVARLLELMGPNGSHSRKDNHYLFEFPDEQAFKIEVEPTHKGEMVKELDFSATAKDVEGQLLVAQRFLDILIEQDRVGEVFKENPYYDEEVVVQQKFQTLRPRAVDIRLVDPKEVLTAIQKKEFDRDILKVPDMHDPDLYEIHFIEKALRTGWFDWLAIEMFPHNMQPIIDRYLTAPPGSEALAADKAALERAYDDFIKTKKFHGIASLEREKKTAAPPVDQIDFSKRPSSVERLRRGLWKLESHVRRGWNPYFGDLGTSKGPLFDLLALCRQLCQEREGGFRVLGINNITDYTHTNYHWHEEGRLVFATRNLLWAKHTPLGGIGIQYGGWRHYLLNKPYRAQDFRGDLDKDQKIERKMGIVNFGDLEKIARYHFRFEPWW